MSNPSNSDVQNLLPVQAYFNLDGSFNTFIGQGNPFYATVNPNQSGLNITNSTINSTTIGATTPSTGVFTNIATTTGTISTQPTSANDIVNLLALQSYAAGISWKQPCAVATLTNITLSGLQTIDGYTTLVGDRVLVKDQSTAANNGIYIASATAWTRSLDANIWDELVAAISFIEYGTQKGGAWFCTAQPGGTLGVTAVNWSQFTTSATYTAGTGLTLTGFEFSITNTGVPASTYGSATATPVFAVNAQGQITSVTNTTITPAIGNITGLGANVATFLATPTSANLAAAVSDETGSGALVFATSPTLVTPALGTPASGNFTTGTFTWPTFNQNTTGTAAKATNLVGGAAGSLPYQSALDTTTFLAAGTNGQVLTLASGVPSWATPTTGTVTSVSGTGTVSGISLSGTVTSIGSLTLGGTLDLSAPPAIGGTTANTITGTTITANTKFVGSNFDAAGSGGGSLRTASGTACLQWAGGGGTNVTIDGAINMNGANSAIQMNPTGTGTVSIAPAGALTVNPTTASTMNNVAIGGTTPLAGTFTDLRVNNTISLAGTTGTAGFVLTSNGASAPTWQASSSGLTITDDTTTNATRYLAFTSATSGSITGQNVSSTKLQFNPSTGFLASTGAIVGAGTVSAPAITTTGDTNTGIFFPAADTIAFTEGGTESMRIDSSGNVGINNSSPQVPLTLNAAGQNTQLGGYSGSTFLWGVSRNASNGLNLDAFGDITFQTNSTTGAKTGSERMRIASNGFVNIGTTASASDGKLSVESSGGSSEVNISLVSGTGNKECILNFGDNLTTAGRYKGRIFYQLDNSVMGFWTNTTERMRIDGNGNLLFNSGYGSVATAYGCRAWVNFNGTGTVSIRASGNVSSITDNNTGNYTINLSVSMPDANFATTGTAHDVNTTSKPRFIGSYSKATGSCSIAVSYQDGSLIDAINNEVAIFR